MDGASVSVHFVGRRFRESLEAWNRRDTPSTSDSDCCNIWHGNEGASKIITTVEIDPY